MIKLISSTLILCAVLSACVTATVNEHSVCDTVSLGTIPGSPIEGISLPPVSFSTQEDFSGTMQKINDITSSYSVQVTELVFNGNPSLQWITQVTLMVQTADMPNALLATYNQSADSNDGNITMQVVMDSNTMRAYLSEPMTLTFTVTGTNIPTTTTTLSTSLCIAASASVTK